MQLSPKHVNAHGQIVGFRLHDSTLFGFVYEKGDALVIRLRRADGTTVILRLGGLGSIGTNGFSAPAIVDDIYAWAPGQTPSGAEAMCDGVWAVFFAGEVHGGTRAQAVREIVACNAYRYVVLLAGSYGGNLAALCNDVDVFEDALPTSG